MCAILVLSKREDAPKGRKVTTMNRVLDLEFTVEELSMIYNTLVNTYALVDNEKADEICTYIEGCIKAEAPVDEDIEALFAGLS